MQTSNANPRTQTGTGRHIAKLVYCSVVMVWLVAASAPKLALAGPPAPAGVPSDYVRTHHGWFHSSCVIRVADDETVDADRVIRGRDGKARRRLGRCGYPRYDRHGQIHAAPTAAAPAPSALPAHVYDGYIGRYGYDGTVGIGPKVVTDWIVPPAPAKVGSQDIAFFNDIQTTADGGDILQPVLDFNSGRWSIESEHCCIGGNDMQTTGIAVAVGDTIRGTVYGTNCTAAGCAAWVVTTTDVTTGKTTTLNTTAPNGKPTGVGAASLESYDITSCDMLPGGGRTTFANHTVTDVNGAALNYQYRLDLLNGVNAELPRNCGYGGSISGNNYTLTYGMVPDAGTPDATAPDAAATDAGRDGATADAARDGGGTGGAAGQGGKTGAGGSGTGGAGTTGTGGRGTGGSAVTPGSGGATASGGSQGSGGATNTGGASSSGGALGTGGIVSTGGSAVGIGSGGSVGTGGAAGSTGPGQTGDTAAGCACEIAAKRPKGVLGSFAMLALCAGILSRRASRRRRPKR